MTPIPIFFHCLLCSAPMPHDWKGKRVLVTGGTGFIGSFLVEALLARGAMVRVPMRAQNYRALSARRSEIEWMEGDLRDSEYCTKLTDRVDEVFHLASCRRNVDYHQKKSSDVVNENVRMSLALIEGMREHGAVPVTFFSTANVPPTFDTIALAQSDTLDGYVLGKALCETLWFAAAHQRGFPLLILRPVGVYGPRDTFNEESNVIPSLMLKTRDAKEHLDVWGTGEQERAFLYVEDLIQAALTLIDIGADHIQYVTSGEVVTVRQLAESIRNLVRPDLPIVFDPDKPIGDRTIPVLPVHSGLSSMQWTPLTEGLTRTFQSWNSL